MKEYSALRSWLFVPANSERFLAKITSLPVDVAILDLEDGVPPASKEVARLRLTSFLDSGKPRPATFVRINGVDSPWHSADMAGALHPAIDGICLPKVETPDEISDVGARLTNWEKQIGIEVGTTSLLAAIESATGLLRAAELATASDRLIGLMLGAEDFALDIGLSPNRQMEARELIYARSAIVIAARNAEVLAVDGVYPDYRDSKGLQEDAMQARRLGFDGKSLFHPGQIDLINKVFSPTNEELAFAERIVRAFDEATARGEGAVAVEGKLIDLPIVMRAKRLLDIAKQGV